MTRLRLAALLGLLLSATLADGVATAATHYVAASGADANAGTQAAPFASLAKAASVVNPGDTVVIGAGRYAGGVTIARGGEADRPVTFRAAGDGGVRLEGRLEQKTGFARAPGQSCTYVVADAGPVAAVTMDLDHTPLVIDHLAAVGSVGEVDAAPGRYYHDQGAGRLYVRYRDGSPEEGHTVHIARDGFGLSITASDVVLEGLSVSGFAGSDVIVSGGKRVALRRCRLSRCGYSWAAAVMLERTEGATIEGCVLYRVQNGIIAAWARKTAIVRNTIYATRAHGVYLIDGADNVIEGNILCAGGRSGSALYVDPTAAAGLRLDHNCYLDSGTAWLVSWMPLGARFATFFDYRAAIADQDQRSLSVEPLFVSTAPGREDFRLQADSPCRGKGPGGQNLGAED